MTISIDEYFEILTDNTVKLQNKMMKKALKAMKDATPVVSGTLKGGYGFIKATKLGDETVITNDVPYFDFVDNGTVHFGPRDMTGAGIDTIPADATIRLRKV